VNDRNFKIAGISKKAETKKRIAFIFNHSFFLGGGEISLFELIKNLDRARFYPIAIVPKSGQIENKLKVNNIDFYINPFPSIKYIWNGSPLISLIRFIKFLKLKKIKILHANGSRVALYAGIAGRILGIPILWHVRETVQDFYCYDNLIGYLSSKIICVSKSVRKKRFDRFGSCIKNKILVVYNGVDTKILKKNRSVRNRVRNELCVDNQILFGLVGNFVPLKGQNFFLKGFALAIKKMPFLKAKAILIGRPLDKAYYESLISLSNKLGIGNKIIFKYYRPNIQEILSALDVFVLPSTREGFSRSILEAMSCSLPIIATKISEIEEAITDKQNGILVDFMDKEKMAGAIIKLCNNESMRKEIGKGNQLVVDRKFNLFSHAKAVESIYINILKDKAHNDC
jgi:glycosyltransferase involved in cell wall biosynthesis